MRAALAIVVALCLASPVFAEDVDGFSRLTLDQLATPPESGRVFFDGRWKASFRGQVFLDRVPDGRVVVRDDALESALSGDRTLDGSKLEKHRSNVRVFGSLEEGVLVAERVTRLPDDEDELRERLARATKPPLDHRSPDELWAIARDAATKRELWGADVARWIDAANGAALDAEVARKKDAADALRIAARALEAGAVERGVALAGEVADDLTAKAELRARAKTLLEKSRAVHSPEGWMTRDRWRRTLGFVERGRRWVRRERAELDDAIEAESKREDPIRRRPFPYEPVIAKGEVARGMKKDEVVRARGGYPRFVDRVATTVAKVRVTWDQWVFADGLRVYFADGEVTEAKGKDAGWPER